MKNFGFGCMRLPMIDGEVDLPQFTLMVDRYLAAGFTYFDTAHGYLGGRSEKAIKAALTSRYPRESYVLADKLSPFNLESEEQIEPTFADELEACGVEYFDYFLMHSMNTEYYKKYVDFHAFEHAAKWKAEGKIKHLGMSFHDTADVLEKILTEQPSIEFVQLQVNYADMDEPRIQSRACLEVCKKYGKPVIVMEPVKGGTLAQVPAQAEELLRGLDPAMSIPSWAIRFVASLPNVMCVLSGMSNLEQMQDNLSYMTDFAPLTEEERATCFKVAEIINNQTAIACTACHYCTDGCPMHICIPEYFSLYNEDMRDDLEHKGWTINFTNYDKLTEEFGRASDCIGCGQCESMCPQHLPIIETLQKVAEHFEH